ncbi:NCS2 family permease [Clostridium sp. JN-1]|uniref:NCS2 family permease n=1 Tax=Clostridium sp. JN-1 TaxID=2483110 RepID=UPI000F0B1637|nr:NCS2 family permease [Clostridium sp. JN-1]
METFKLKENNTTIRQEVLAGITSFFAISYIIIVNPIILSDAGMPKALSAIATVLISFIGCMLMGIFANVPIILTPGMGVNAFFTYTMVVSMKLTWQQSLAVVFISSIIYMIIAFTGIGNTIAKAIPDSLKTGITVGIGLFLVVIGLEKGSIIISGKNTIMTMNNLAEPQVLLALFGILISAALYIKNIRGSFFIGIVIISVFAFLFNIHDGVSTSFSIANIVNYNKLFFKLDFSSFFSVKFFLAVFSLSMILIFESIGLLQGLIEKKERFNNAFKISALTVGLSSILGTSPTVAAAESAAGIKEGGKTGLTAVVCGMLFLISILCTPLLKFIPSAAICPVIVITGAIMMENLRYIDFSSFTEWFPAFLIIVMIPLTSSIANGLAFGFIIYPILKIMKGEGKKLRTPLYIISFLFLLNLISITLI